MPRHTVECAQTRKNKTKTAQCHCLFPRCMHLPPPPLPTAILSFVHARGRTDTHTHRHWPWNPWNLTCWPDVCPFRGSLRRTLPNPRRCISHPLLPLNSQETAAPWNLGPCGTGCLAPAAAPMPSAPALKLRASGFQLPLGELPLGFGGGKRTVAGPQASGVNFLNVCRASSSLLLGFLSHLTTSPYLPSPRCPWVHINVPPPGGLLWALFR